MFKVIMLTVCLFIAGVAFAATGTKPNQMVLKFHNVSSSTKAAESRGEMRFSNAYVFVNVSTSARPHWRRIGLGGAF